MREKLQQFMRLSFIASAIYLGTNENQAEALYPNYPDKPSLSNPAANISSPEAICDVIDGYHLSNKPNYLIWIFPPETRLEVCGKEFSLDPDNNLQSSCSTIIDTTNDMHITSLLLVPLYPGQNQLKFFNPDSDLLAECKLSTDYFGPTYNTDAPDFNPEDPDAFVKIETFDLPNDREPIFGLDKAVIYLLDGSILEIPLSEDNNTLSIPGDTAWIILKDKGGNLTKIFPHNLRLPPEVASLDYCEPDPDQLRATF